MLSSDVISARIKLTKEGSTKFFKRDQLIFYFLQPSRCKLDFMKCLFMFFKAQTVFAFLAWPFPWKYKIHSILALCSMPCSNSYQQGLKKICLEVEKQ